MGMMQDGAMPGPGMASRMMQMMPMFAGSMLAEMAGESQREYLFNFIGSLMAQTTEEMSDEEYSELINDLTEYLKKRDFSSEEQPESCC